ncbi:MAG: dihydrolipoyl dehydrogenase, partial [Bacteroidales bacterium]|nr:dihydrolipoyl dehydrogenase [Bacteroidales bacterium]
GETDGYCKLIVADDQSGRILGCHLVGPHSADIVHEACAMITRGASLDDMRCVIHAHPTLSEVLQNAVHA